MDVSLVHTSVGREVGVVLGAEAAELALELPLLGVDCLVLLQGVLVAEGLAADGAGVLGLAVGLLVLPQGQHRVRPEVAAGGVAAELGPAGGGTSGNWAILKLLQMFRDGCFWRCNPFKPS